MMVDTNPREMDSAPKTGERILLRYAVMLYDRDKFKSVARGSKWEECHWVKGQGWKPWCGSGHTVSTATIVRPIEWLPLPGSTEWVVT